MVHSYIYYNAIINDPPHQMSQIQNNFFLEMIDQTEFDHHTRRLDNYNLKKMEQ